MPDLSSAQLSDYLSLPIGQYYISVALVLIPMLRIFMRAGLKPYWGLGLLVPWAGYVICAVALGFNNWPKVAPLVLKKREKKS